MARIFSSMILICLSSLCFSKTEQSKYLFWLEKNDREILVDLSLKIISELERCYSSAIGVGCSPTFGSLGVVPSKGDEISNVILETRKPLGKTSKRELEGVQGGFNQLPGLPTSNQYAIVTYSSRFVAHEDIFTEQLVFARVLPPEKSLQKLGSGSTWKLASYYVSRKPYYRY